MAPTGKADEQVLPEKSCKSCLKATRSEINCVICNAVFHGSCAVRLTGTKVVGYNELHCNECVRRREDGHDAKAGNERQCYEQVVQSNQVLNEVILKLMADRDNLSAEIQEVKGALKEFKLFLTTQQSAISRQNCQSCSTKKTTDKEGLSMDVTKTSTSNLDYSKTKMPSDKAKSAAAMSTSLTEPMTCVAYSQRQQKANQRKQKGIGKHVLPIVENSESQSQERTVNVPIDPRAVYAAIHEETARMKAREIINLGNAERVQEREDASVVNEWKTLRRRNAMPPARTRRPSPIRGRMESSLTSLTVAPRKIWLFVSGFSPSTTGADLKQHIEKHAEVTDCVCEKLKTRKDDQKSSFKLEIKREDRDKVMVGSLWPTGTMVNHFRNLRRNPSTREESKQMGLM